jgi:hypothetical protein
VLLGSLQNRCRPITEFAGGQVAEPCPLWLSKRSGSQFVALQQTEQDFDPGIIP